MEDMINYNDLIFLVIDGEASDVERATLFKHLSENIELQNEFQLAIKMQKASENIGTNLIPPTSLANNIFQSAGLNYVPNSGTISSPANLSKKTLPKKNLLFYSKSTLTFTFLGMLVGAVIMYLMMDFKFGTNGKQTKIGSDEISFNDKYELPSLIMHYPIQDEENKEKRFSTKEITPNNNFTNNENEKIDKNDNQIINDEPSISINQVEIKPKRIERVFENNEFDKPIIKTMELSPFVVNDENNLGLSLEIKNSAYWNFNQENVFPSEISKFHNMDLFIFKSLGSGFNIGLGVKQETFYAQYKSVDEMGREYIFEQQPNLTNFESAIRFFPLEENLINPFIQLNLGLGEYGYSYRLIPGATINFMENFATIINIDLAGFTFTHKNETYRTEKIGFNYGIIYKF